MLALHLPRQLYTVLIGQLGTILFTFDDLNLYGHVNYTISLKSIMRIVVAFILEDSRLSMHM